MSKKLHGPVNLFADEPVPFQVTEAGQAALNAIPSQPAAPRTWTFINRRTGQPQTITCMPGCTIDHTSDIETPTYPEDVWCWTLPEPLTLPVNTNGHPEEFRVLDTVIKVEPWSEKIAERLPYAVVELVDDHFIEGLDPDGYETLINTLQDRLDQMRATHARLVAIRAEYMGRQR